MTIPRVAYPERQRLHADDLNDEQAYRLDQRRRHNVAHHGWGIVSGLELVNDEDLELRPGMATDGYGREIVVPAEHGANENGVGIVIPPEVLDRARAAVGGDGKLAVWLLYCRHLVKTGEGKDRREHWQEDHRVRLSAAPPVDEDPALWGLPAAARAFEPQQRSPDDPKVEWPIFLGTVGSDGTPDAAGRRYATLTGDMARDPAGRVEMSLAARPDGAPRFAARLRDAGGKLVERLTIDPMLPESADGFRIAISGEAHAGEDVHVGGEPPATAEEVSNALLELSKPIALPIAAAPWRIYRTSDDGGATPRLRVELGHLGGEAELSQSRLVVGYRESGEFRSCLTVAGDGNVTVHGDLEFGGELIRAPIAADPDEPEFVDEMAARWQQGVEAVLGQPRARIQSLRFGRWQRDHVSYVTPNGLVEPGEEVASTIAAVVGYLVWTGTEDPGGFTALLDSYDASRIDVTWILTFDWVLLIHALVPLEDVSVNMTLAGGATATVDAVPATLAAGMHQFSLDDEWQFPVTVESIGEEPFYRVSRPGPFHMLVTLSATNKQDLPVYDSDSIEIALVR